MIQILLNLLKLSLPGIKPATPKSPEKPRKKRKKVDNEPPPETDAERLESYMDKLSMWQLTSSLDDFVAGIDKAKEKNWTQKFCEDVVEPL